MLADRSTLESILWLKQTGYPKPITYTREMTAAFDVAASLPDIDEGLLHHAPMRRWYTPLPSLHV